MRHFDVAGGPVTQPEDRFWSSTADWAGRIYVPIRMDRTLPMMQAPPALRPERGDPLVPEEVYAQGRLVQLPRWQGWAKAVKANWKNCWRWHEGRRKRDRGRGGG